MAQIEALSPSAEAEPRAFTDVDGTKVAWSPERGWLCSEHTLPCIHTEGLPAPQKHPTWRQ